MWQLHSSVFSVVCTIVIALIQLLEGRLYFLDEEGQDKNFYISNTTTIYAVFSARVYSVDVTFMEFQLVPSQTDKFSKHHGISLGPEAVYDHLHNVTSK